MKKLYKQTLLLGVILLFLVSVSFAADENQSTMDMDQSSKEVMTVEDNVADSTIDISVHEDNININEDISKNIKGDEEEVPVEYVNITQSNYKNYFTVMGKGMYMGKGIINSNNSMVLNMQYFPGNVNSLSVDENSVKFANRTLTITSDGLVLSNVGVDLASNFKSITLENFNITYDNSYNANDFVTISDDVNYCHLNNVSINVDKDGVSSGSALGIYTKSTIENCNIRARMVETIIDWDSWPRTPSAIGVIISASDCILKNNIIDIISSGNAGSTHYSLYALYCSHHNTLLENNTITLTNATGYAYGLVFRSNNNRITGNNITVVSHTYSNGVNFEMSMFKNNMVDNNYVNVTASYGNAPWGNLCVAYALQMLDFNYNGALFNPSGSHPSNNTYANNTLVGSAGQIYGIEIYGTYNTNLTGNTINISGRTPMGIGVIGAQINIADNNIYCNGTHALQEGTADYLNAFNTGLYSFQSNQGIVMKNNNVTVENARAVLLDTTGNIVVSDNNLVSNNYEYAVEITGSNNIIENNTLISSTHTGDMAVNTTKNNIVQNNIPVEIVEYSLKVDTTEFTVGSNTTITAKIYYGNEVASDINKGKVSFKVNGKTLKDANGKVIYAKVINGTATIEDYSIPESWNTGDSTVQAVYSGSTDCNKLISDKERITVTTQEPSITTSDVEATVGTTVTLTATINAPTSVNAGKVVFKINGKTVKDANGKVIYAKVTDGVATVSYDVPLDMKVKEYLLTATFISSEYGRLEDTKILTIN